MLIILQKKIILTIIKKKFDRSMWRYGQYVYNLRPEQQGRQWSGQNDQGTGRIRRLPQLLPFSERQITHHRIGRHENVRTFIFNIFFCTSLFPLQLQVGLGDRKENLRLRSPQRRCGVHQFVTRWEQLRNGQRGQNLQIVGYKGRETEADVLRTRSGRELSLCKLLL